MEASAAPRDDRWRERNAEIPRLVESAEEKFRASNGGAGLREWNAALDREAPPPRAWLLGNSLCRRYVSSLLAGGGTGKSAMRILQALALATGRKLTDEHVFQRCRVLIVSLEDDADELRRRIRAACLHYDIARSELDGWLFLAAPGAGAGKLKAMNPGGQIVDGQLRGHLEAAIERHQIDCLIIDPLVKAHSIEENSNSAVDGVLQLLSDVAIRYDVAVDVPHHTSKGQDKPGDAHRGRGASALIDATRLAYTLTPMSEEEAKRYDVPEEQRRQYVRYDRAKVNLTAVGGRETWFKLIGVRIGNETDMYPSGDEVQTVEVWSPPSLWANLPDARLNSMLTEIDRGLPDGTFYTAGPNASTRAAWQVVIRHAPAKSEQEARKIIQTWLRSGLLVEFEYSNPETRKTVRGLRVDDAKRPGTICALD
ncbi:AAA family ATPase [Bradyrhizobium liaoningense]|uniref:AAA family ATPase n=1 Tax=Bradyrhizobium liaoningense TaxID=43992 RepID=UPI001BACFAFC|nr:AAA family ATPase [Bradyrhizobium liaoningense]MBR0907609.1 AAA family ATPase [Bradyrhizobium liaoningense]